jgi:hypothetical protein
VQPEQGSFGSVRQPPSVSSLVSKGGVAEVRKQTLVS